MYTTVMVTHRNVAGNIRFPVTLTSDKLFSVDTRSRSLLKQAAPRSDNPGCFYETTQQAHPVHRRTVHEPF